MEATNIVDVVSEFVSLRKTGVNYKGLCPFHDDKTPSFIVSPSKGICHCFACGKGGNAVNFLMEHEQITYPEALRWLANKYHIEIKERELTDDERREQSERESMYAVNEWAKDYFHHILNDDPEGQAIGKQYFRSRGIRDDIIEKFQLGYALPRRNALCEAAVQAGYKEEFLLKTGLCYRRDTGELVDRYAGRVIFPWLNVSGKVNSFGGRLLDSRTKGVQQKYVNAPESDIYHKDHELYGLYQAKRAITKEDCVYMVEGYTDVIAMHQCGIENVVANSGTALSVHQIKLLRRFTTNVVLLYDGDEAGIHAAMRGTDMLLAEGMNIRVLLLPDGDDPDSFARKHTAKELAAYVEEHQTDFISFKTELTLKGVTDPVKRSEAIGSIVKSISVIPNQITRDTYVRQCAYQLQISEQTLINTMNKLIRDKLASPAAAGRDSGGGAQPQQQVLQVTDAGSERRGQVATLLAQCVVRHGDEVIFDNVETEDGQTVSLTVAQYVDYDLAQDSLRFDNPLYNQVLQEAVAHSGEPGFKAESYFVHHPDINVSQLANSLAVSRYQLSPSMELNLKMDTLRQKVVHLILDYRLAVLDERLKDIQRQLRQAGTDMQRVRELMESYRDTKLVHDALAQKVGR